MNKRLVKFRRQYVALTLLAMAALGLLGTALEHLAPTTYATSHVYHNR